MKRKKRIFIFFCSGMGGLLGVFLILFCWWYGFYPEWGKMIKDPMESKAYRMIEEIKTNPDSQLTGTDIYPVLKEEIPQMTTQVLVDVYTLFYQGYDNFLVGIYSSCYNFREFHVNRSAEEIEDSQDGQDLMIHGLLERHAAGRLLMKAYQEAPLWCDDVNHYGIQGWDNRFGLAYLEMILVQEEIQQHLTPWQKEDLMKLADEKQKEKFSDPDYPDAEYNYLYTDTYGYLYQDSFGADYENDKDYFCWFTDTVIKRAKPFESLRDGDN